MVTAERLRELFDYDGKSLVRKVEYSSLDGTQAFKLIEVDGVLYREDELIRLFQFTRKCPSAKSPQIASSGTQGVYWHKTRKKWRVMITVNGQLKYVGLFDNKDDAIKARKDAEIFYYGSLIS